MNQSPTRISWLDTGRGISIILVVFYHVIMMAKIWDIPAAGLYEMINYLVKAVRMPFFFAMSGLLLSGRLEIPWLGYARRYLYPTIWLFLIWNTIYTLLMGREWTQVLSSILWPADIETHLWFLWALALFRILAKAARPAAPLALLLALAISPLTYGGAIGQGRSFVESNLLRYGVFFLAAAWYGPPMAGWLLRNPWMAVAMAGLIFLGCWPFRFRFGFALSGVMLSTALAILIARHLPTIDRRCAWLGRRSLEIFILHFLFIHLLLPPVAGLPGHAWWGVPAVTLAAVALPIAMRKVLDPYAPWLFALPRGPAPLRSS